MKVLILSAPNPMYRAGVVARDILEGINSKKGSSAQLITGTYGLYDKNIISSQNSLDFHLSRIKEKMKSVYYRFLSILRIYRLDPNYCIQYLNQTKKSKASRQIIKKMAFKPDVIIVLFMNKYLNYMDLYEIQKSTNAPIYLYMMDMAIMTGGCHYSWDCKGYYKSCGSCPGLNSNKIKDQTWKNMQINKSCVERMQIFPIAASNNLFEQLENSSLFKHKERYKVILPVNSRHFNVSQKSIARSILNIPQNKKIIFFGAVSITERRKGFLELLNILENLYNIIDDKDKYHIIIAGQSDASIMQSIPFSCSHLGNLSYEQLPLAYQSSNIFVCPSIQDSGPMMINQSITCGIPVVSFNIGVSKDLIINGETGYIIPLGDTTGFANSIKKILDLSSEDEVIMSQNCRRVGVEQCETEVFVNNIINIIR